MTTIDISTNTFTKAEILESIRRLFDDSPVHGFIPRRLYRSPEQLNAAFIADMRAHREPDYNIGDVVVDSREVVFTRTHGGWYKAGDRTFFRDSVPHRPLRVIFEGRP